MKSAGRLKIGYSKNPWKRYRQLCTGCPNPMALIMTLYCYDAPAAERFLHNHFKAKRGHGEWFDVSVNLVMTVIAKNNLSELGKPVYAKIPENVVNEREPSYSEEEEKELDKQFDSEASETELAQFFADLRSE